MATPNELNLFNRRDRDIVLMFYKTHLKMFYLFAHDYLDNWQESKDVVTNAFLKLCASKEEFESEEGIKSYLRKAVKNECIDRLRKRKVHGEYVKHVKKGKTWDDATVLHAREKAEIIMELMKALQGLSPMEGNVVNNIYYLDKSQAETAEDLKLSLSTVKRLKRSAILKLQVFFKYKLIMVAVFSAGVVESSHGFSKKIGQILTFFHELIVFISDQWNIG